MEPKSISTGSADVKSKRVIFRATKDQIMEAQKILKAKSMYNGEETGKLDDATRDSLKKFQEANGVKVTGTLNQVTLEKLGIELTDKQKTDSAESTK
jgi:peptidoglycan hydrolase-like protein with peptidoglycan-binding domain